MDSSQASCPHFFREAHSLAYPSRPPKNKQFGHWNDAAGRCIMEIALPLCNGNVAEFRVRDKPNAGSIY